VSHAGGQKAFHQVEVLTHVQRPKPTHSPIC
jgi:hypothetical protein